MSSSTQSLTHSLTRKQRQCQWCWNERSKKGGRETANERREKSISRLAAKNRLRTGALLQIKRTCEKQMNCCEKGEQRGSGGKKTEQRHRRQDLVDSKYLKFEVFEPFLLSFVDNIAIAYRAHRTTDANVDVDVEWHEMDERTATRTMLFNFPQQEFNLFSFLFNVVTERCGDGRTNDFHFVQREHERVRILPISFSRFFFLSRSRAHPVSSYTRFVILPLNYYYFSSVFSRRIYEKYGREALRLSISIWCDRTTRTETQVKNINKSFEDSHSIARHFSFRWWTIFASFDMCPIPPTHDRLSFIPQTESSALSFTHLRFTLTAHSLSVSPHSMRMGSQCQWKRWFPYGICVTLKRSSFNVAHGE